MNNAIHLDDYRAIVGNQIIDELYAMARPLEDCRVKMINSTAIGGGVAEILRRLVPLLAELGLRPHWEVMQGSDAFFRCTKKMHHALQGNGCEALDADDLAVFVDINCANAGCLSRDDDFVVVHDPQPIALVAERSPGQHWIWRCHIDLSCPAPAAWDFLRPFAQRYDAAVFSSPQFCRNVSIPEHVIYPPIDPLADKNRELPEDAIAATLDRLGVPRDRPIVTQISRFDPLKDPVGVIRAFRIARKQVDCRLVLAGGGANDDPERPQVLAQVLEEAGNDPAIHVLADGQYADADINALVRGSSIVMQKSLKEGFGLTVAEALWKRKAVVAGAAGGIPLQIVHDVTGMLVSSVEEAGAALQTLLADPARMRRFGDAGRAHVAREFLIIANVRRWLALFRSLDAGNRIAPRRTAAAGALAPG